MWHIHVVKTMQRHPTYMRYFYSEAPPLLTYVTTHLRIIVIAVIQSLIEKIEGR